MPVPAIVISNRFLRAVAAVIGNVAAAAEIAGISETTFRTHIAGRAERFSPANAERLASYFESRTLGAQNELLAAAGVIAHHDTQREIGKMRWAMANPVKFDQRQQKALDAIESELTTAEGFAKEGFSP